MTRLSTQQLVRLSRLLDEALDRDAAGREQWLQALAPEHHDLEPALRRALFRDDEPLGVLPNLFGGHTTGASRLREGDLLGPYRLLRPLGAGGMAEVWLAERADGAFKREVALKTPSHLPWRQDLIERFAVERDILAALEHPHIARFYDAGIGADGRPYVALEYVVGRDLIHWADEHQLGIRARIELFLQVLQAVQYAHDKGVLHRDIKPGNVLVTEAGDVKLLDFGVARLMEGAAQPDLTLRFGKALTPGYASPEQLKGEAVGAASDVYSLGVVLHELLSGRLPDLAAGRTVELQRPRLPPSARLDAKAAAVRGRSAPAVARALRGDFDAITLKALAPLARDRYESADSLASDLRRALAQEPVSAMPDSRRYRAGKFLLRHRVGVAQTAGLAVIIGGMGVALLDRPSGSHTPPAAITTAAPLAPASDKSIAVLPFADLSEQHDQAHFSDGLAEELIDRLAHSHGLRVIARTSAFAFKGRNDDIRSIAAQLGVAYVVQGSVRKSAQMLRITARLVRAADGVSLWSQSFDRDLADLFKVQDEIAGAVAHALEALLIDRQRRREPRLPDPEAYNLVLQGDVYSNGPLERDVQRAEVSFKKAIALDPGYALPWVKLALLSMRQADLGRQPKDEAQAQARQAIETALKIEPDSIAAHAVHFRQLVRDFSWADARTALDRMRTIDPADALLLPACEAAFASVTGKLDEAIKIQRLIVHRDPLNAAAVGTLASYLLEADRLEESQALFRRELQLNPHAVGSHALIGVDLALLGRGDAALAEIAREQHKGYRLWAFSIAHWMLGHADAADAALDELKQSPQSNAYWIARLYAVRGKKNLTFEWLNKACAERQTGCDLLKTDRFLRDLRDDTRYRTLLAKLKLDGGSTPGNP